MSPMNHHRFTFSDHDPPAGQHLWSTHKDRVLGLDLNQSFFKIPIMMIEENNPNSLKCHESHHRDLVEIPIMTEENKPRSFKCHESHHRHLVQYFLTGHLVDPHPHGLTFLIAILPFRNGKPILEHPERGPQLF